MMRSVRGVLSRNQIVKIILHRAPELKTPGFLFYTQRKKKLTGKIDYSKIADRVVEQAFEHSGFVLDEHAMQRLLQGKIDRARQEIEARVTCPVWHTDR
jgi:hypothetical protein